VASTVRPFFVAEVSGSSFGLGFETGYLLGTTDKRVMLLYRLDREDKASLLITGNTQRNCTLVPYSNVGEVVAAFSRPAERSDVYPDRKRAAGFCELLTTGIKRGLEETGGSSKI
jgi:hypothetical protein